MLTEVNLLTTSIECRDMSILRRAAKYLQREGERDSDCQRWCRGSYAES